jgi:hypothetical protein
MSLNTLKKLLISMLFLFLTLTVFAQSGRTQSVALIPFWGDDEQFIQEFGEVLYDAVGNLQGYRPVNIDMNNLPDDVPEGGFPPYICPSPSLTKTNEIALTGELTRDPDDDELWSLRLYLWEMTETRLVFSDKLDAYDREEAEANMPSLVTWLFDWLKRSGTGNEGDNIDLSELYGQGKHVFITTSMPLHWIYIGGRVGWTSRMQFVPDFLLPENSRGWTNPDERYVHNSYDTLSAALSVTLALFPESVPIFSRLNLQLEGVFNYDFNICKGDDDPITLMTINPTVLLKTHIYRHGNTLLSVFLGSYAVFFLNNLLNNDKEDDIGFNYKQNIPIPLGATAGLNFGGKLDPVPGLFIIDLRFSMDIFNTIVKKYDEGYTRWGVTLSLGYEYGLIRKK